MKKYVVRIVNGFFSSAIAGALCLLIIELIMRANGLDRGPLTPEFIGIFPSESIAVLVDVLVYGLFGAAFGGMTFIYEQDQIGFVIQNIIYAVATGLVWIPIIIFMWQLYKYPQALISTIGGFFATYVIITVISYKKAKKDVEDINKRLERM